MVTAHALRGDVVDIEGVAAHDVGPSSLSSPRAVLLKFGSANRGSNYRMHLCAHGEMRDWDVSWTGAVWQNRHSCLRVGQGEGLYSCKVSRGDLVMLTTPREDPPDWAQMCRKPRSPDGELFIPMKLYSDPLPRVQLIGLSA